MRRDSVIQLISAGVMAACLSGSIALTPRISSSAAKHKLVPTDQAETGVKPEVALGIAMGAFRGLFVNMLWIRANDLKEEGKYYEAVDLASAITKLQPLFPRVWCFHAWNLAYNISVETQTLEERWHWVQAGINLLRAEGVRANPKDILIHKELAWIHLHKVSGVMDDAGMYYKRKLAEEWTIVCGGPRPKPRELQTAEQNTRDAADRLMEVYLSPDTLEELYNPTPTQVSDFGSLSGFPPEALENLGGKVRTLVEGLKEAGIDLTSGTLYTAKQDGPAEKMLRFIEEQRSVIRMVQAMNAPALQAKDPRLNALLENLELRPAWRRLIPWARRRLLIDKYSMDPALMIKYTLKYGPLDWRHASAHAVYWGEKGVEEAKSLVHDKNRDDFDVVNTDRIVIQAVQDLFRSGDMFYDILNPTFMMQLPNADFIPIYSQIVEEMALNEKEQKKGLYDPTLRTYTLYGAGYENFMKDVVRFLFRRGDFKAAEAARDKIRLWPGRNLNDPKAALRFSWPLERFVVEEIAEDDRFGDPAVARTEVVASLYSAYLSGLYNDNPKLFKSNVEYARQFFTIYNEKHNANTNVNVGDVGRMSVMGRDFDLYAGQVLATLIYSLGPPDGPILYNRAPDWLKLPTYAMLERTSMKAAMDAGKDDPNHKGPTFDTWFRPPEGIEAYRAKLNMADNANERGTIEAK